MDAVAERHSICNSGTEKRCIFCLGSTGLQLTLGMETTLTMHIYRIWLYQSRFQRRSWLSGEANTYKERDHLAGSETRRHGAI